MYVTITKFNSRNSACFSVKEVTMDTLQRVNHYLLNTQIEEKIKNDPIGMLDKCL